MDGCGSQYLVVLEEEEAPRACDLIHNVFLIGMKKEVVSGVRALSLTLNRGEYHLHLLIADGSIFNQPLIAWLDVAVGNIPLVVVTGCFNGI